MTASLRQYCADFAEDERSCFIGPKRHWLRYKPTCVVNLQPIAIGLQIEGNKSAISSVRLPE